MAFAFPALACGAHKDQSAQSASPTTTATAPMTPKPADNDG